MIYSVEQLKARKSLKNAVWQYLLEHSNQKENGTYDIHFTVNKKKKFWGHITAREKGYEKNTTKSKTITF